MAKQATDARITPFAGMFMLAFQFFESGWQMTLKTIFARAHGCVLSASGHWFGSVARGQVIQTANDNNYDQGKNQVT